MFSIEDLMGYFIDNIQDYDFDFDYRGEPIRGDKGFIKYEYWFNIEKGSIPFIVKVEAFTCGKQSISVLITIFSPSLTWNKETASFDIDVLYKLINNFNQEWGSRGWTLFLNEDAGGNVRLELAAWSYVVASGDPAIIGHSIGCCCSLLYGLSEEGLDSIVDWFTNE